MSIPPDVDLVLASASPRRAELLQRLGLRLAICPTNLDETAHRGEAPSAYVARNGQQQVRRGRARADLALPLLAADTIVTLDGAILGKPDDRAQAEVMLRALAGRRHEVLTAYALRLGTKALHRVVTTQVAVRLIDEAELIAYLDCEEWRDKAGAYAIQGKAALFVTDIRGSFTNVIGLPLAEVIADLRALGGLSGYPPRAFGSPNAAR